MDEASKSLLEHGALGAIIVLQSGLIIYLLREVFHLQNKLVDLLDKTEELQIQLEDIERK